MKAIELYAQLEEDFIAPEMSDDWAAQMDSVADFLSENFKKRSMGLVCDFAVEINKIYTAVFPEKDIMQNILADGAENAMLFVHHPSIWDIRKAPSVFQEMDRNLLQQFKERKISIYNLHVPLDNYGDYSTSATLAKALGFKIEKPFAPYFGGMAGVFGLTDFVTVQDLRNKFQQRVRRRHVHAGGWLIQNQNVGLGRQRAGDEHALFLAAGELAEFSAGKTIGGGGVETFADKILFRARRKLHRPDTLKRAHQRHVKAGERIQRIELDRLRHIAKDWLRV